MQQEYFGSGSINKLDEILAQENPSKIFLVTGKNSYFSSGAKQKIEPTISSYQYVRFSEFSPNPKIEDIEKGIEIYKREGCDLVIAIGGGSVIDTAKAISVFSVNPKVPTDYIVKGQPLTHPNAPFIAIPTTSGSGSEATHFAVIYINKVKYSLKHKEFLFPDYCIIDPELTHSLSPQITAHTGLDAFSQAIEAYWSVDSTEETKRYAGEAIKLILNNLEITVNNPTSESRIVMAKASNLAGKAINISKTTACHAISYPITSYFGIPHGHAVALTLGEILVYNNSVTEEDCLDLRGIEYVKENMLGLINLLNVFSAEEAKEKIQNLMKNIGLATKLSNLGIESDKDIDIILKNGFNQEKVKNNPRKLTKTELGIILKRIK